jgi:hypothetical protein
VATLVLIANGRNRWAGATFGLMATMKLLPLIGAFAFCVLPISKRERIASFAAAIAAFLAVHVLNAIMFKQYFLIYVQQLIARVPGGADFDRAGSTQDLMIALLRQLGQEDPNIAIMALAFFALLIGFWLSTALSNRETFTPLAPTAALSIAMLVLWLFVFRLKPYTYETFVPFIVAAGYGLGQSVGRIAIVIPSVLDIAMERHVVKLPFELRWWFEDVMVAWITLLYILYAAVYLRKPAPSGST